MAFRDAVNRERRGFIWPNEILAENAGNMSQQLNHGYRGDGIQHP